MCRSRSGSQFVYRLLLRDSRGGAPPPGRFVSGRSNVGEGLQHQVAVPRRDALGMELQAVHWQAPMRKAHNEPVIGVGVHGKIVRQARAFDDQGMIARRLEGSVDAPEDT